MKVKYFKVRIEIERSVPEQILLLSSVERPIEIRFKRKVVNIFNDYTSIMFSECVWIGSLGSLSRTEGKVKEFFRLFKDNLKRDRRFKKREIYTLTLKESK